MEISLVLLRLIGIMFLLMGIGFLLFKKKMVTKQGSKELSTLLLYVIMPGIIIKSFLVTCTVEKMKELLFSYLLSCAGLLIAMLISKAVFGHKFKMENFGSAFSNAGFIGIPLVRMALGEEAVFYVSAFVVLLNLLQWTYGVFVITEKPEVIKMAKIVKNPVVISFMVGFIVFVTQIPVPSVFKGTLEIIGNMNAPVAMIVLGIYLAQTDIKAMFTDWQAYKCSMIRLIIIPLVTILLFMWVPRQYETMKMAILIAACAPVGVNVAVFAQMYDMDYTYAVKAVCLSTIFSIVTMPLMIALAQYVW